MSKYKPKRPQKLQATEINNADNQRQYIDYDRLGEAIVKAKKIEQEQMATEKDIKKEHFQKQLGYRTDGNSFLLLLNHFWCTIKIIIFPKKYNDPHDLRATQSIMILFIIKLFAMMEMFFYFMALIFLFYIFSFSFVNKLMCALGIF